MLVMLVGGRQEHSSEHVHCHSLYVSSFLALPMVLVGDAAVLLLEISKMTDELKNIRMMQIKAAVTHIVVFLLLFVVLLVLFGGVASAAACCLLLTSFSAST